jgi:hypothetical protein
MGAEVFVFILWIVVGCIVGCVYLAVGFYGAAIVSLAFLGDSLWKRRLFQVFMVVGWLPWGLLIEPLVKRTRWYERQEARYLR